MASMFRFGGRRGGPEVDETEPELLEFGAGTCEGWSTVGDTGTGIG